MIKVLETERLILRRVTPGDFDALKAVFADPVAMEHYPEPYDDAKVHSWIRWAIENHEKRGLGPWAVVLKSTGECIGDCGITLQIIEGKPVEEVGYHLQRKHWKQGYATEAAAAARDHLFDVLKKDLLVSWTRPGNAPSRRVMERIGLKFEKEAPDRSGVVQVVYSMTRKQYEELKGGASRPVTSAPA